MGRIWLAVQPRKNPEIFKAQAWRRCLRACNGRSKKADLKRAVHVMLGLPGESHADMVQTAQFVASTLPEGIKFHDFHIVRGSAFARCFLAGEITLMHPSRMPALLADCLEVLPPQTEIIRLSADFRPEECINLYPPYNKHHLARHVEDELARRGSFQGSSYIFTSDSNPAINNSSKN